MGGDPVLTGECQRVHEALDARIDRFESAVKDDLRVMSQETRTGFESVYERLNILASQITEAVNAKTQIEEHKANHIRRDAIVISVVLALIGTAAAILLKVIA